MGVPRFRRAKAGEAQSSPNLFVANCGPAVGVSYEDIKRAFGRFGEVRGVYAADESGSRVIVSYVEDTSAEAAFNAFNGRPCPLLGNRSLHIRYSVFQPPTSQVNNSVAVSLEAAELNIPGLYLLHDFVTLQEEEELLAAVDNRPWKSLSKRRVQHYGYEFCYDRDRIGICQKGEVRFLWGEAHFLASLWASILKNIKNMTRNVNTRQCLGELPSFVSSIVGRISSFPDLEDSASLPLDQLTVNEYPTGVGLSPHIDTHSAFEGLICSLSLAGPCIMEFRRYSEGAWLPDAASSTDMKVENPDNCSSVLRRAVYLPPRSMLLLSGEARYAWHHYIPHHKIDMVNDNVIKRGSRRVSFTFRKVRVGPCQCKFPQYCDVQR